MVEPPKAVEPPKPVEPPKVVAAPLPVAPPKAVEPATESGSGGAADDIPAEAAKSQIRRIAFVHLSAHAEAHNALLGYLSEVAAGVTKKPIYIRRVLIEALAADADIPALVARIKQGQAGGVIGILEGMPKERQLEFSKALAAVKIKLAVVSPKNVKVRTAVFDTAIEIMLWPSAI